MSFSPDHSLADRLRSLREERGWNKTQLFKLSNIPVKTIQRLESGETLTPRDDTLRLLADAFNTDKSKPAVALRELQDLRRKQTAAGVPATDEAVCISGVVIEGTVPAPALPIDTIRTEPVVLTRHKARIMRTAAVIVVVAVLLGVSGSVLAFVIKPGLSNQAVAKPFDIVGTASCANKQPLVAIWVDVLIDGTVNKAVSGYADLRPLNSNAPKKRFAFLLHGDGYNLHVGCGGTTKQWQGVYRTEAGTGPVYDRQAHFFICLDASPGINFGPCDLQ